MNTKVIIGSLVVVAAVVLLIMVPGRNKYEPIEGFETVSGTVANMALSARTITLVTEGSSEVILALVDETELVDASNDPIALTEITAGSVIEASGTRTGVDTFIPDRVRLIMTVTGEGADISACPATAIEDDSGSTCRLQIASRMTITLPNDEYALSSLMIDPARKMGEIMGTGAPAGKGTRTLEAVEAGQVIITVPSTQETHEDFKLTVLIFDPDTVLNQSNL